MGRGHSYRLELSVRDEDRELVKIEEMEDEIYQEYGKCFVDMVGTEGQAKGSGEQEQEKDAEAKLKKANFDKEQQGVKKRFAMGIKKVDWNRREVRVREG